MFFRYNLFGILWALLILLLSVIPGRDLPQVSIINFDVLCHVFFYAVLVFLCIVGFIKQYDYYVFRSKAVIIALLGGIVYGVLIEAIQHFFCDGRYFDIKDILANFIGCLGGRGMFFLIYYKV